MVFSQWTALLDLLEIALKQAGVAFVRLDGSLSLHQREHALNRLQGLTESPSKQKGSLASRRLHPPQAAAPSILDYARRLEDADPLEEGGASGDGSTEGGEGQEALGRAPDVILMSLKAGGLGLNLACCNNVFLLDPWWNPQMEHQAVARVHRCLRLRLFLSL